MRTVTCLALLVALAAVTRAQDEAPPKPEIKLYRMQGAQWNYRIVNWNRASVAESSTEECLVEKVEGDSATVRITGRNFSGNNNWRSSRSMSLDAEHPVHRDWADSSAPAETLKLAAGTFACRKHRSTSDGVQTTTWVSTEYHPLIVKQVSLSPDSATVRTLTSFDSGETDPWLLYRMVGRSWTLRFTETGEGKTDAVQYMQRSVTRCTASSAVLRAESLDADRKPIPGTQEEIEVDFSGDARPQGTRETLAVGAGEFDCIVVNDERAKVRTWYAAHWQALVVAQEGAGFRYELVEFDLGHDSGAFHRVVGNEHTIRMTSEFGGNSTSMSTRTRVTAIEDGRATIEITMLDDDNDAVSTQEQRLPVSESTTPRMPYTGQHEVLLRTPAGEFPALLNDMGDVRMWQYHGVLIRMTSSSEGFSMKQELTSLKLEPPATER